MVYSIGNRIRTAREAAGIKQKDFADLLGVSQSKVSNWENGTNRPNADQLSDIVKALKADANYILGITDEIYIEAAKMKIENEKLSELPEEERQMIDDLIELRYQKWLKDKND